MSTSLNVIALISGGKDSIYSLLHCQRQGHRIIALANLYPPPSPSASPSHDLNSFMYQTVGHTLIPLYSEALALPLYRQPISGSALQTDTSYAPPPSPSSQDETEALVPLLQRIVAAHPTANAVCSGAILSTYQRTRIESVAVRLGLVPLSFLWKFPVLGEQGEMALLTDMRAVGMEARIVKVASGGLDEGFLWADVLSEEGRERVRRAVGRFGGEGEGAVIGEGGEFETMVVDGPVGLFKGRIVVEEGQREVVREEGGVAWVAVGEARVEMVSRERKERDGEDDDEKRMPRVPDLLDLRFHEVLGKLREQVKADGVHLTNLKNQELRDVASVGVRFKTSTRGAYKYQWTILAERGDPERSVPQEMDDIVSQIKEKLNFRDLMINDVISTLVILRSMEDFSAINKVYGALFCELNPPARVTIACGDVLPHACNIVIHMNLCEKSDDKTARKALHVQSRSYWAPANIGPYSQARSVPVKISNSNLMTDVVFVAGQIPLVPATMALPSNEAHHSILGEGVTIAAVDNYLLQTVLSLQHLWRIGKEMDVSWWAGAVAYLSRDNLQNIQTKAKLAGSAWENMHTRVTADDGEDDEDRDLWDLQHRHGQESRGANKTPKELPDWSVVKTDGASASIPPFFAAELEELPRESAIEWHAFLGVTNGRIWAVAHEIGRNDMVHLCFVGGVRCFAMITVPYSKDLSAANLKEYLSDLTANLSYIETSFWAEGIDHRVATVSYLDISVKALWEAGEYAGVVPCRSLWSRKGERLAAVYCYFQDHKLPYEGSDDDEDYDESRYGGRVVDSSESASDSVYHAPDEYL